ncbi:SPOSA6832_01414 [Sporobolomyces salmonicolor]|uniref:SPOSA6832_01414-mRNA-1:cds n=1 Tax=Sporidiobolus salmonicolor TaxID=5005 RepID=A0A0D6EJB4_SPOSA|nr:SPOSA6832_01414 [Sporobolomyces salmonicolor]
MTQSSSSGLEKGRDEGGAVLMDQIVMFGVANAGGKEPDSITQGAWVPGGTGAALAHAYQRKLREKPTWFETCSEHLPVPKMLMIWFGANDAALPPSPQSITIDEFKSNLDTIISLVRAPTSPYHSPSTRLVLLTPPPVDDLVRNAELASRVPARVPDRNAERTRLFAEAVKDIAAEHGIGCVDTWRAIMDKAEREDGGRLTRFLGDGLHLTPAGYEVVTAGVFGLVKNELPDLMYDKLPQVYPHWAEWIPEEQRF